MNALSVLAQRLGKSASGDFRMAVPDGFRRRYRHLTPRYGVDRVRLIAYERRHPDAPWLTSEAVAFLEQWLRPDLVGFEWGSGRSTVWLAQRVRFLTSIEHDAGWFEKVRRHLDEQDLAPKVDYRHFAVNDDADADHPYACAISEHRDGALHFCLIDGVAPLRAQCALACLPKLAQGGIAIVDRANWFLPRRPKFPGAGLPWPCRRLRECRVAGVSPARCGLALHFGPATA